MSTVHSGVIELHYWIEKHSVDGNPRYDWHTTGGAESDEWFHTIEEAIRDIEEYF